MGEDNGDGIKKEQDNNDVKEKTAIVIIAREDGGYEMRSLLPPPVVIFIFEQIKLNLLMNSAERKKPRIIPATGAIMNFARRFKS